MKQKPTIRVGLIGCGAIAVKRLLALKETELGVPCLLFDPIKERAQALADQFGGRVAGSAETILCDEEVNAVIVATPNRYLYEYGKVALQEGKHTLLEKPGATTAAQAEALEKIRKDCAKKPICKIGYNHRFHPAALRLFSELQSEEHGKTLWVRAAYGHGGRPGYEKEWRFNRQLSGGGEMIDQGVHLLDLVQWGCGEPLELVSCDRQNAFYKSTEEDNGFLQLRSQSGARIQLHCSVTQWKNLFRIEWATSNSLLVWDGLGNQNYGGEKLVLFRRNPKGGKPTEHCLVPETFADNSWSEEWRHFCHAIEHGEDKLYSNLRECASILKLIGDPS
ncbi:MAG: Gfo/Idh/MocA family oxidoreductase [Deltaproteobacteria bacterium]|nr:Gfo/Idh/MocA family oxidoreductase [Deltaproteobacteria bacterium]